MLTQEKIQRYSSQIILPEIGAQGQKKICNAKVLIIGVGGLGSACSLYLAAAGVGFFGLLDNDELELSNLHRQILYKSNSVGKKKTTLAANRLKENNPNLHCELYTERFDFDNYKKEGKQKFEDYNLIIDCSDNMQTKISANRLALHHKIPIIFGAAIQWSGNIFACRPFQDACYECLYSLSDTEARCDDLGVVGPLVGIIGTMQALTAVKILTQKDDSIFNQMHFIDSLHFRLQSIKLKRKKNCPACSSKSVKK